MDKDTINLDELLSNCKRVFQIQLNNTDVIIKNIGTMNNCSDILIKDNLGKNNNLNLYNCIYTQDELLNYNRIYPLIKLIKNNIFFSGIGIKFEKLDIKIVNTDFKLYFMFYDENNDKILYTELIKNINKINIIQILFENILQHCTIFT